tara:strand:- start:2774 stop:2953 length:180 start_codon:yes stop_codon:yes gene_type:complete
LRLELPIFQLERLTAAISLSSCRFAHVLYVDILASSIVSFFSRFSLAPVLRGDDREALS